MIVDWSNGENIYVCIISARKVTTHETKHYEWVIVMRDEYDFSKGERGDFYRPNEKVHLPLYLDDDVHAALLSLSTAKGKA